MTAYEAMRSLVEAGFDVNNLYMAQADAIEDMPFDLCGALLVTGITSENRRLVQDTIRMRLGQRRLDQGQYMGLDVLWIPATLDTEDTPFTLAPLADVLETLRSPEGCSWDKLQTHSSLRRYLLEEVYEILDAIDHHDDENLKEELGDVLLQIVFHARVAEERGAFTLQDVVDAITAKMIRRHPHVFERDTAEGLGRTLLSWEALKAQEKGHKRESLLDGVSKGLPALLAAQKLQEKAAKVGFDWDSIEPVWDKVYEEIDELKAAICEENAENMEKEAGDVIFSLINLFRWYRISGENALNRTNTKFSRRFCYVERRVAESGRDWETFSIGELDTFWREAKLQEHA